MGVFFVLVLVPVIFQHTEIRGYYFDYKKKNRLALALFFFVLTVLIMFRHESIGNDTRNYINYFSRISKLSWSELNNVSLEKGYVVFNKLISFFTKDSQVFLSISAIAVSAMIYPTFRRLNSDSSLTISVFCIMSTFVMMFSGIRQMIAIAIGFIAYEFARHKKLVPFIISVVLAMSFHTSAFMLAFMYPLFHAKITKKWLYVVVPALAVVFVFNKPIFSILSMIIARYTQYGEGAESTGAYTMLLLLAMFAVFAFVIPDESRIDKETIGQRNFLLLALAIQMFAPLHTLAMRMNYYYIIFIPLLLPKVIEFRSERWKQVAVLGRYVMVVFFVVYFFYNASRGGNLNVFPYHFFWENI